MPLKAWVKNALDQVIQVCLNEPELEFAWVGDDAVDPLQQAQTLSLLVGAGIKTREEARAELGLAGAAKRVAKYNHNHDERGRFTTPENAVEPGTHKKPDSGVEVAENEYNPTMTDAGGGETTVAQGGVPMFEEPPAEPVKPAEVVPATPNAVPEDPTTRPSETPVSPATPPASGAPNRSSALVDPALVAQLVASGVKITPENVVATGITPSGKVVWLETGNDDSGLQHIVKEHAGQFSGIGVTEADIPQVVMDAVTNGTIVGYQGKGTGRPIYETTINGQSYNVAITISDNGYIVGANLRGKNR